MANVGKGKVLFALTIISLLTMASLLVGCNDAPSAVGLSEERTPTKSAASATPSASPSSTPSTSPSATPTTSPSPTPTTSPSPTPSISPSHTASPSPSRVIFIRKPTWTPTKTPIPPRPSVTPTPTIQFIASSSDKMPPAKEMFAAVATPYANELKICIPESQESPMAWRWVIYEDIFACAIPGDNLPPKLSGRYGYAQPPAIEWLILDLERGEVMPFPEAENRGLSFSRDGQYAVVSEGCYYETCKSTVYRIDVQSKSSEKVCRYETWALWYRGGCPLLPLQNGEMWDIKAERNALACAYYGGGGEHCQK